MQQEQARLFFANVPWNADDVDFDRFCDGVCEVVSWERPTDRDTGVRRPFVFVDVALPNGITAQRIAELLNGQSMKDARSMGNKSRKINVQVAMPDPRKTRSRTT